MLEEYMKLQNMKKWLGDEMSASVELNVNHSETEVSRITSEIGSNKIKRLSRHFQMQENVRHVKHSYIFGSVKQQNNNKLLFSMQVEVNAMLTYQSLEDNIASMTV